MIHEANRRSLDQLDTQRLRTASRQDDHEDRTPLLLESHHPKIECFVGLTRLDFCERTSHHYESARAFIEKFQRRTENAFYQ